MRLYLLKKKVFHISPQPAAFLKGITSNDLDKPQNAFLNIHGRIIATFDQLPLNEEETIILIEEDFVDPVLAHIDRFIKLSKVSFENMERNVYFDLDGDAKTSENDVIINQKSGRLIITESQMEETVSEKEFTLFRIKHNLPRQGVDYHSEMLLNVSTEDYVSFTKGCYLGQEPISKVHLRSKPSWRLIVKNESDCNEEERQKMTSKVLDMETGITKGFVFIKNQ